MLFWFNPPPAPGIVYVCVSFIYSGYRSFVTYMYCNYFLPVCGLGIYFCNGGFQKNV